MQLSNLVKKGRLALLSFGCLGNCLFPRKICTPLWPFFFSNGWFKKTPARYINSFIDALVGILRPSDGLFS